MQLICRIFMVTRLKCPTKTLPSSKKTLIQIIGNRKEVKFLISIPRSYTAGKFRRLLPNRADYCHHQDTMSIVLIKKN